MYILQNKENTLKVDEYFVKNSGTISNMLTDLDDWNSNEPIPLPIDFKDFGKYYSLYQEVKDIVCEGKKIMEYLQENLNDYIEKYPQKNIDPPFYDKILELSKKLSLEDITEYIKIADFLDMLGLTRIISLIYSVYLKNIEDYDDKVKIYKRMRQRLGHINLN